MAEISDDVISKIGSNFILSCPKITRKFHLKKSSNQKTRIWSQNGSKQHWNWIIIRPKSMPATL